MTTNISKTLGRHFEFLEKKYGLQLVSVSSDKWDRKWLPRLAYAGKKTGVFVEYDVREEYLGVTIHHLDNGVFPQREGRIVTSEGYSLNGVIYLHDPKGLIGAWRDEGPTRSGEKLSFDDYVAGVAEKLRVHAADFLSGDFGRATEVEQAEGEIMAGRERSESTRS
jgi:hypothetical protein